MLKYVLFTHFGSARNLEKITESFIRFLQERCNSKEIGTEWNLHDDVIRLQVPECFEASYCIRYSFFCEESLVRDTNLHNRLQRSQMTSSCKCPIS